MPQECNGCGDDGSDLPQYPELVFAAGKVIASEIYPDRRLASL